MGSADRVDCNGLEPTPDHHPGIHLEPLTNYFNLVARTDLDFPAAPALAEEPAAST